MSYLNHQLFSFHITCLHTRLTEFLLNCLSLHKSDRILTKLPKATLSRFLYRRVSSLMNALEGEYFCIRDISLNVNKLLVVLFLYAFIRFILYCTLLLIVYDLHTYIISNYNPSAMNIILVSHSTYGVCANFIL